MPGIIGVVGSEERGSFRDLSARMCQSIKHEDWYKTDVWLGEGVALGRVSLGTLNPEPQPIFSGDGSLCIVMEGEIYDSEGLKNDLLSKRHSFTLNNDPELLLHAYAEYGESFVKRLNGRFVLAIWDMRRKRLIIANDRYGLKFLYYAQNNGRLLFGSEVKAILADGSLKRVVNPAAVADFFTLRYIQEDKTLLNGISLLPPASVLTYEGGRLSIKEYWDWNFVEDYPDRSEDDYVEELRYLLRQAVERRMGGDEPIALALSGGVDSRTIVAYVDRGHFPVTTYTYGMPGSADIRFASAVATRVGSEHHVIELKGDMFASIAEKGAFLGDGMLNSAHAQATFVKPQVARFSRIVLEGQPGNSIFGDQLAGGRFFDIYDDRLLSQAIFKDQTRVVPVDEHPQFFAPDLYHQIKGNSLETFERLLRKSKATLPANKHNYIDISEQERRFILSGAASDSAYVEHRAPYYDNDLIDFMLAVPPQLRLSRRIQKKALIKESPSLARVPHTPTRLPVDASAFRFRMNARMSELRWKVRYKANRASRGLIAQPGTTSSSMGDISNWIRTGFTEKLLLDERTLGRGYFNPSYVRQMVTDYMAGRRNNPRQIGALVTFELWHRRFLD